VLYVVTRLVLYVVVYEVVAFTVVVRDVVRDVAYVVVYVEYPYLEIETKPSYGGYGDVYVYPPAE
jgi:hypothetical protein